MDRSTACILVLDDDTLMLDMLSHVLRSLGFNAVSVCDNGHAALQIVGGERPPELILLDLNMPDMDGVEFVRKLADLHYDGRLVLVSGEEPRVLQMAENLFRAHHVSVIGQLKKPFTRQALAEIMDKAVRASAFNPAERKRYDRPALQRAIDHGHLVNYYQPKVDVATGALVGVETLVRWLDPDEGLIFPDQFVGVAEQCGLIDQLTRVVLGNALAQSRAWKQAGLHVIVAVNVSMDNLSSVDFVDFVAHAAAQADVAPHDVVLEVTESRLMLDQRAPLEVLARLRMKRFGLSIDDFGTGHASLSQLRDIPFDELKIDRSFVHDAWKDATARAIYDASLALGKKLGMTVVAEGVENKHDWELLRTTKCDLAQGYFIGRPLPAAELGEWIQEWKRRVAQGALGTMGPVAG
jgi:EAL domain-containing protein (putative c-di-GMP-specific phosphodiesterase class I)/FixJ family two-component response regulator